MNSCYSSELSRSSDHDNFGFAFNDSNFSDRILCIQIVSEPLQVTTGGESCTSLADWARNRKRPRDYINSKNSVDIAAVYAEEQIINKPYHIPDDEGQETMIEESPLDQGANDIDSSFNMDYLSSAVRVKTIHVSSPILAAKSPFFYKLFSNGMKESEQRQVNLRINASEEAAVMELLNFIYSNTLTATTVPALLDVLMAADRFEVASCMRHCINLLRDQPMTPESALLYLHLPSSVLMAETVQPLTDAAKDFLAVRYKDIAKFQDEVINFPLVGVEAILSSDDLQVASEDAVYDFVLKWARIHYPKIKDRREIFTTRLANIIRFSYMSCRKLREVVTCSDFDHNFAQKVVLETFFSISESPHKNPNPPRAYVYKPVKVVSFELPRQQCNVYMDLKREECASLFPSGRINSQAFRVGGQRFILCAICNMDQQHSFPCFGLYLGMHEKGSVLFTVDYEFGARSKPNEEYISKFKGTYNFTASHSLGCKNLFAIPWTTFIGEESVYFINGVLHLRAQITIRQVN